VNRVQAYFDSGGDSLAREFSAQRDAASANLAFEDASRFTSAWKNEADGKSAL